MKTVIVTILVFPPLMVALLCAAISLSILPWGTFKVGPFEGYSWNGGANIGFGRAGIGYHSGSWNFKRDILPGLTREEAAIFGTAYPQPDCSLIYVGPFLITRCGINGTDA